MKEQLKKLQELNIDLDLFYVISINKGKLHLQGHLTSETKKQIEELGFKFNLSETNDWIEAINENIIITLTF